MPSARFLPAPVVLFFEACGFSALAAVLLLRAALCFGDALFFFRGIVFLLIESTDTPSLVR
jgi:hypothetical protein